MAGWISSKLKVAESFLQQIDQQVAESLGKGERAPSPPPLGDDSNDGHKKKAEKLPLKLQLHKKPPERGRHRDGGPRRKGDPNSARNPPARAPSLPNPPRTSTSLLAPAVSPGAAAAAASDTDVAAALDGDWTKLLGSPKPISPIAGGSGGSWRGGWLSGPSRSTSPRRCSPLTRFLQCQLKNGLLAVVSDGALYFHVVVSWLFIGKLRLGLFAYMVGGGCPRTWNGFSMEAFTGLWGFAGVRR